MIVRLVTTLAPSGTPSGGTLVTEQVYHALARHADVDPWAIWSLGLQPGWQGAQTTTLGALRRAGVVRALTRRLPLTIARFHRPDLAARLASLPAADLVVADHLVAWEYVRGMRARRRVLIAHNIEADIYQRAANIEPDRARRLVWRREAALMAAYEERTLAEADTVVCLGEHDRAALRETYGVEATSWLPAVPHVHPTAMRVAQGRTIGLIATVTWQPNRWGIDWLVHDVWPALRRRMPQAILRIGGPGSEQLPYAGNGIELLGPVDDIDGFYDQLDVVVAPVIGGSGIKVKVLDAAARGLPVVATTAATRGLPPLPERITACDDVGSFVDALERHLQDRAPLPCRDNIAWYGRAVSGGDERLASTVLGRVARATA